MAGRLVCKLGRQPRYNRWLDDLAKFANYTYRHLAAPHRTLSGLSARRSVEATLYRGSRFELWLILQTAKPAFHRRISQLAFRRRASLARQRAVTLADLLMSTAGPSYPLSGQTHAVRGTRFGVLPSCTVIATRALEA